MIKDMKKCGNKGMTLIEMVFSLIVVSLGMVLLSTTFPLLKKIQEFDLHHEEELVIEQIRQLLLFSSEIEVYEDELSFFYLGNQVSLSIEYDRIVRRKGYVIYMDGIENGYFSKKDECIYLNYEKENRKNERIIGCI